MRASFDQTRATSILLRRQIGLNVGYQRIHFSNQIVMRNAGRFAVDGLLDFGTKPGVTGCLFGSVKRGIQGGKRGVHGPRIKG